MSPVLTCITTRTGVCIPPRSRQKKASFNRLALKEFSHSREASNERKPKMKLQYNLFGFIPTTHEMEGYTVCITSYRENDPHGIQVWTPALTYLGAIFTGWRLSRMYALMEGRDHHYFIYAGTESTFLKSDQPLRCRTIRVTKKVAFFSK